MRRKKHVNRAFCRTRAGRFAIELIGAGGLATLAGCASAPQAAVSDPSVYTVLHLKAAEGVMGGEVGTLETHMIRYFGSTTQQYATSKLRIDEMLDGQQQTSANLQAAQSAVALSVTAQLLAPPASAKTTKTGSTPAASFSTDSGTAAGGASAGGAFGGTGGSTTKPVSSDSSSSDPASQLKALQDAAATATSAPVIDSPFDQLDRAADLYAEYLVKILQLQGDSRMLDPVSLAQLVDNAENLTAARAAYLMKKVPTTRPTTAPATLPVSPSPEKNSDNRPSRLLLLVFQTHIDPGTEPDRMVGVRVKITRAAWENDDQAPSMNSAEDKNTYADCVKLLRIRPTRSYDISANTTDDSLAKALTLSGQANVPFKIGTFGGSVQNDFTQAVEARQKYLSHISKNTSYADATTHTFGWNFYPSNLKLSRPNLLEGLADFLCGEPKDFVVHAYLEGGARDCEAVILVPQKLRGFTCQVSSIWANIDPVAGDRSEHVFPTGKPADAPPDTFTVEFPPYVPAETAAASKGYQMLIARQMLETLPLDPDYNKMPNTKPATKTTATTKPAKAKPAKPPSFEDATKQGKPAPAKP
jgi:hypothetical protein